MDLKDYMTCVFLLWFANAGIATPVLVGFDNGLQKTVFPAVFSLPQAVNFLEYLLFKIYF